MRLASGVHCYYHLTLLTSGDDFKSLAETYLASGLDKGIPSLFADIKALYQDHENRQVIAAYVESLREELASLPSSKSSESEAPTTYLWTLYFLAQHYSHISDHKRALSLLDLALEHTPTLPELYMYKARVLKRLGDPIGAARSMDDARVLDLQDRFLNTKCAKYRLRAGLEEEAQEILGLFTKVRPQQDTEIVLMQKTITYFPRPERRFKPCC